MIDIEKMYEDRLAAFIASDPLANTHGVSGDIKRQIMQETILDFMKAVSVQMKKDLEFLETRMSQLAELSKAMAELLERILKMAEKL